MNNKTAARKTPGRLPRQELQNHSEQRLWGRWIGLEHCRLTLKPGDGHSTTCCAQAAPVTGAEVTGCGDSTRATWGWGTRHHRCQGGSQRGNGTGDTGISSSDLILQWDYATIFSILFPCPGQASRDSWVHSLRLHPPSPRCDPGYALPEPSEIFVIYSPGSRWNQLHQPSKEQRRCLIFKSQFKAETPQLKRHPGEAEFTSQL